MKICSKQTEITTINEENLRQIKDLKVYDDVYLKIDDTIYEAWVFEKTAKRILLNYTENSKMLDTQFIISEKENKTIIQENNRVLILNNKDL